MNSATNFAQLLVSVNSITSSPQQGVTILAQVFAGAGLRISSISHHSLPEFAIEALGIQPVFDVVIHVAEAPLPVGGGVPVFGKRNNSRRSRKRVFGCGPRQWEL